MRILFTISLFVLSLNITAQQNFTEHLTRQNTGEGTVVLHQDNEIDALVNGLPLPTKPSKPLSLLSSQNDSTAVNDTIVFTPTRRVRTVGYRIQVYAGGNNRNAKSEAYRMANQVHSEFPDLSVYTHFISPRWICRVGDFRTNEEARTMLRKMRQTQKFREASIVKSQIIVYQ